MIQAEDEIKKVLRRVDYSFNKNCHKDLCKIYKLTNLANSIKHIFNKCITNSVYVWYGYIKQKFIENNNEF